MIRSVLLTMTLSACTAAANQVPPVPPMLAPGDPGHGETIKGMIVAGAEACARGDQAGVMRQYDRTVLLSYPGTPDIGYDELAASFARLCKGSGDGTVEQTVPTFEELIVGPDTAVVRIMWTTHLRGVAGPRTLRDMQYWHRTPEGWRFRSGVHWPYTPEPAR